MPDNSTVSRRPRDGQGPSTGFAISDRIALAVAALAVVSQTNQWRLNLVIAAVLTGIALLLVWQAFRERASGWSPTALAILVAVLFSAGAFAQVLQGISAKDVEDRNEDKRHIQDAIVNSGKQRIALYKDPTNTKLQGDLERYYLTESEGGDSLPLILAEAKLLNKQGQKYDPTANVVIFANISTIAISADGTTATVRVNEAWRQPLVNAKTGERVEEKTHQRFVQEPSAYELKKTATGWRIRHNPTR